MNGQGIKVLFTFTGWTDNNAVFRYIIQWKYAPKTARYVENKKLLKQKKISPDPI